MTDAQPILGLLVVIIMLITWDDNASGNGAAQRPDAATGEEPQMPWYEPDDCLRGL